MARAPARCWSRHRRSGRSVRYVPQATPTAPKDRPVPHLGAVLVPEEVQVTAARQHHQGGGDVDGAPDGDGRTGTDHEG
jgi:hypothetical protein